MQECEGGEGRQANNPLVVQKKNNKDLFQAISSKRFVNISFWIRLEILQAVNNK